MKMEIPSKLHEATFPKTNLRKICIIIPKHWTRNYTSYNLCNKLLLATHPETYQTRTRRSPQWQIDPDFMNISKEAIDVSVAEKQILTELGPKACVLEEPCRFHAGRHRTSGEQPDWNNILR